MVSRAEVLGKASEWVGMMERTGNNDIWFADDWGITGSSWCFAFVQSCFYYTGGQLPTTTMYCPTGVQYARDNGQSIEVGGAPIPGDIVFYTWGNGYGRWTPGTGDHVGVVEDWDGGDTIWTIEGNVGDPQGVYRKTRSIDDVVICFWRPTVYDGTGPTPQEEDLTPEQEQKLDYVFHVMADTNRFLNMAGLAIDTKRIVDSVLWHLGNFMATGGREGETVASMLRDGALPGIKTIHADVDHLAKEVAGLPGGDQVIDVEESLKQATAAQLAALGAVKLLAAINELLAAQGKPPVPPPAEPDAEPDATPESVGTPAVG